MNSRFLRRGRQPGSPDEQKQQPGFPAGEARLIDICDEDGSVVLTLDDGTSFELARTSVPKGLPGPGELVPAEVVAELRLAAERKQVARLILAMLDRRLQPVARIRDKAAEKGYSMAAVDAVLEQMAAKDLYSDRKFAEAYCRDCLASRSVGRRYLVAKLRNKRVPADIAIAVAGEILDRDTEGELADRAATARWKRLHGPADLKTLAKVVRHLQNRGFDAGTANRAARKMQPDPGDD